MFQVIPSGSLTNILYAFYIFPIVICVYMIASNSSTEFNFSERHFKMFSVVKL